MKNRLGEYLSAGICRIVAVIFAMWLGGALVVDAQEVDDDSAFKKELTWGLGFQTVFDNREGDNKITDTKTLFFTVLQPEIGLRFTARDRIAGGIVWTNPIGNEWEGARVQPTLYYRHEQKRWSASLGMFPRSQLREELPNVLWSDSLSYFQKNIRGALVQYHSPAAFVDFYLDWRQLQTDTKREAFNIVFHGQWSPKQNAFMVGGHVMMNHFALTKNSPADQHIVDNFLVNPYLGVNLSGKASLDSLQVRAGAMLTVERNRATDNWTSPVGAWVEATAEWRWLGVKNSFYMGGKLFPSYWEHGSLLYQREPFYQTDFYNRTDIYARIVRNKWVDFQASLDFNVARDSFIFYQRLMVRIYLDGKFLKFK